MSQQSYHGYSFAGNFPDEVTRLHFHIEKWLRYHSHCKNWLISTANTLIFASMLLVLTGIFASLFYGWATTVSFGIVALCCLAYPIGYWNKAMEHYRITQKFIDLQVEYQFNEPQDQKQVNAAFRKIVNIHRHSPWVMELMEILAERATRRGLLGDTSQFKQIPTWRKALAGVFSQSHYVRSNFHVVWTPQVQAT